MKKMFDGIPPIVIFMIIAGAVFQIVLMVAGLKFVFDLLGGLK